MREEVGVIVCSKRVGTGEIFRLEEIQGGAVCRRCMGVTLGLLVACPCAL